MIRIFLMVLHLIFILGNFATSRASTRKFSSSTSTRTFLASINTRNDNSPSCFCRLGTLKGKNNHYHSYRRHNIKPSIISSLIRSSGSSSLSKVQSTWRYSTATTTTNSENNSDEVVSSLFSFMKNHHVLTKDKKSDYSSKNKICILTDWNLNTNNNDNKKINDDNDDNDLHEPEQKLHIFSMIEKEISERLQLPIISLSKVALEQQKNFHNTTDVGLEEQLDLDVLSNSQDLSTFTHGLVVEPFEIWNNHTTFAVSILTISSDDAASDRKRQKNNKRKVGKNLSSTRSILKNIKKQKPFYIDFSMSDDSRIGKRLLPNKNKDELLFKTIKGVLSKSSLTSSEGKEGLILYDFTAGFGQDSALFASIPQIEKVFMMERDVIVSLLLSDALRRLHLLKDFYTSSSVSTQKDSTIQQEINRELSHSGANNYKKENERIQYVLDISKKLHLLHGDAVDILLNKNMNDLQKELPLPDVCYLDPMFPPRTTNKKSATKKNMQILHSLLHSNDEPEDNSKQKQEQQNDEGTSVTMASENEEQGRLHSEKSLLDCAFSLAQKRIVVKRPIHAPYLGMSSSSNNNNKEKKTTISPSYDLKGSINRFDVYNI